MEDFSQLKNIITEFPLTPGVYTFKNTKGEVLYVGKATSLRDRARSYLGKDLLETRGPMLIKMRSEATSVEYIETDSVLEALILEANLIKKFEPPYNTDQKDGKSFNYVVITNEDFPRVLIERGRTLPERFDESEMKYLYGPFTSSGSLTKALKIIRKIFPYRDTCVTAEVQARQKSKRLSKAKQEEVTTSKENWQSYMLEVAKPCFNAQIGMCPGVCAGEIDKKEYARTINHLRLFFEGKKGEITKELEREMKAAAADMDFEYAQVLKDKIYSLYHIKDTALITRGDEIETRYSQGKVNTRIEAYDVAHLSGENRVGVMVVIEDGVSKKSDYRKFKIRSKLKGDTDALLEILERRFAHTEWDFPSVLVVDGSVAQINVAKQVRSGLEGGEKIHIVGVVKDEHHRPRNMLGLRDIIEKYKSEILLANAESHRFAQAFHRSRRRKSF